MSRPAQKLTVLIASDLDYEQLVAEIYCDDKYVLLISQDNGSDNLSVVFPGIDFNQYAATRRVDLNWLRYALDQAECVLLGNDKRNTESSCKQDLLDSSL